MAGAKQFNFPKFPETLFVKQEQDGGDTYLVASGDASDLAEKDVAIPAAEYKLVRPGVVIETKTTVTVK